MRYLAEVRPAGLLVLEPADLVVFGGILESDTMLALLALAELGQVLRARELLGMDPLPFAELAGG